MTAVDIAEWILVGAVLGGAWAVNKWIDRVEVWRERIESIQADAAEVRGDLVVRVRDLERRIDGMADQMAACPAHPTGDAVANGDGGDTEISYPDK